MQSCFLVTVGQVHVGDAWTRHQQDVYSLEPFSLLIIWLFLASLPQSVLPRQQGEAGKSRPRQLSCRTPRSWAAAPPPPCARWGRRSEELCSRWHPCFRFHPGLVVRRQMDPLSLAWCWKKIYYIKFREGIFLPEDPLDHGIVARPGRLNQLLRLTHSSSSLLSQSWPGSSF